MLHSKEFAAEWVELFSAPDVADILSYVVSCWPEYLDELPQESRHSIKTWKEPVMTESFNLTLNDPSRRKKLRLGEFQPEVKEGAHRDNTGKAKYKGRSDIRYKPPVAGTAYFLIEFKKLTGKPRPRKDYVIGGMVRFVDGRYSGNQFYGAMCGIICENIEDEISMVESEIDKAKHILRCQLDKNNSPFVRPSEFTTSARFDTKHFRDETNSNVVILAHVFLNLSRLE